MSFRHTNRHKAQAVVREVVTSLTEWNVIQARKNAARAQNLEAVAPANLPATPASPNRFVILLAGLTAGLTGGIVLTRKRRSRAIAAAA